MSPLYLHTDLDGDALSSSERQQDLKTVWSLYLSYQNIMNMICQRDVSVARQGFS